MAFPTGISTGTAAVTKVRPSKASIPADGNGASLRPSAPSDASCIPQPNSMLQDLERGRPMEMDPLVTVVQEMGRLTQIPTPALDAVLALVAQRAKIAGLYSDPRPVEAKPLVFA